MRKLILVVLAAAAAYYAYTSQVQRLPSPVADASIPAKAMESAAAESSAALQQAFAKHQRNLQVEVVGVVEKQLSDDNDGARHQRFLVKLASGQTVLIAHNIDLAPRVTSLADGDRVMVYGEYEWNNKGGVVHWTHSDPAGRHVTGWIKHRGQTYQ